MGGQKEGSRNGQNQCQHLGERGETPGFSADGKQDDGRSQVLQYGGDSCVGVLDSDKVGILAEHHAEDSVGRYLEGRFLGLPYVKDLCSPLKKEKKKD